MGLEAPGTGDGARTVSSYAAPTAGSISFWVRPDSLTGVQRILGTHDDFEGRFDGAILYHDWLCGGSTCQSNTLSTGTLYHFVCTWDTGTPDFLEIYQDGVSVDSSSNSQSPVTNTMAMFNRYLDNDEFEGALYDIRLYDRELTAAEVLTIYNSRGKDSIVYGMTNRWTLDEGANGTTLSGTGVVKDRGARQINWSSVSGAPDYVYDADLTPRRR